MHTLVHVKNAYTVMTICLYCIAGTFVVHATAWAKDNVHVIWSVLS